MKVYLDNNATTPLHPEVAEEMRANFGLYGNPSSHHSFGRQARKKIEEARAKIAAFIGAQPAEIVFTSCGSEANNLVIKGTVCCGGSCHLATGDMHIVTSAIEHPSVLETCRCIAHTDNSIDFVKVDKFGRLNPEDVEKAMRPNTSLVTIMLANNEIGTIQPIAEIARVVHKHNVKFHVDAVQGLGKIPINVKELDADFLTLSAHKIYGPKGVGALYVRHKCKICPLIDGGHQERNLRAGTENTLGIIAFGKAVECVQGEMAVSVERQRRLRDKLEKAIVEKIPDILINGHPEHRIPNTLNVSFKGIEGEGILIHLDDAGIMASTGSACSSDSLEPSHVLIALGLTHQDSHGSVRFSLGRENTEEEIDYLIEKLPPIIAKLRAMSPLYEPSKK